ncbi:MAG: hypothetical protein ACJ77I_06840 [Chloroflexota bacterium]
MSPPASTPLQDGWLEYQVMAKLPRQDTRAVRVARLAYYAGASHVLAQIAEHGDLDPSLLDLLVAELDAFIADIEGWRP